MINHIILSSAVRSIARQSQVVFSEVNRNFNDVLSRQTFWLVGLLCGVALFTVGIAKAQPPSPPMIYCAEASEVCAVVDPTELPKKWHAGHYMQITHNESQDIYQNLRFGYYDEIADSTQIKGVVLGLRWGQLESSEGNYTFTTAQADLDYLKNLTVPKRLFIRIHERDYGATPCDATNDTFPIYMRNALGCATTANGTTSRIWEPYAQERLIALYTAMAAQWDAEPYFEGIYLIRETATNGTVHAGQNFTSAGYVDGLKNIATGADSVFIQSNVVHSVNYAQGDAYVDDLIAHNATLDIGQGSPDTLNPGCSSSVTDGDQTLKGLSGGVDYRGSMPVLYSAEASVMGGVLGDCLPVSIRAFANDTLKASHLFWTRNTFTGTAEQQWYDGILPFISDSANDLTYVSCPSNYEQGCDTN